MCIYQNVFYLYFICIYLICILFDCRNAMAKMNDELHRMNQSAEDILYVV